MLRKRTTFHRIDSPSGYPEGLLASMPIKVNRKPVRAHAMDGAAFPHTIKVKYTIDGKDYICRKWIGAGNKVPDKGTTIKVTYWEDKPSKARIEL